MDFKARMDRLEKLIRESEIEFGPGGAGVPLWASNILAIFHDIAEATPGYIVSTTMDPDLVSMTLGWSEWAEGPDNNVRGVVLQARHEDNDDITVFVDGDTQMRFAPNEIMKAATRIVQAVEKALGTRIGL